MLRELSHECRTYQDLEDQLVKDNPDKQSLLYNVTDILMSVDDDLANCGMQEERLRLLREVLDIFPYQKDPMWSNYYVANVIHVLYETGREDEGDAYFEEMYQAAANPQLLNSYLITVWNSKQYDKAREISDRYATEGMMATDEILRSTVELIRGGKDKEDVSSAGNGNVLQKLKAMGGDDEDMTEEDVQAATEYIRGLPRKKQREVLKEIKASNRQEPIVNTKPKIGRNDPCPCGSGKKYKNCCMKKDNA